ncbi:MAG: asparagine synthase (glutamine-hydrolyzing) [Alphaproteobacteria bacterium]
MCGIAGAFSPKPFSPERVDGVLARMQARGPDGEGVFSASCAGRHLTLFHTRLSIVDPVPASDQPMTRSDLTLVFNGEIYNHTELRRELESLGRRFRTASDTEVVLAAYEEWSTDAFRRFEGMWALALFDAAQQCFVLSRDRFGEKPLYLWKTKDAFFFASEIKALSAMAGARPAVNDRQIRRYLVNGYKSLYPSGETFYRDIEEFPRSSFCVFGNGDEKPRSFWSVGYNPQPMSLAEAVDTTQTLVTESIDYRLRADVPVAIRLSGGIDSNVLTGTALKRLGRDVETFSIVDDDPRYDETRHIDKAIGYFGGRHHRIGIPKTGFWERMDKLVRYFDGPMMTISYYLHALVSEAIHEAGIKVSLGGTGADEIFSGYYDHYLFWLAEMKDREDHANLVRQWRGSYGQFVRNPHLQDPDAFVKNPSARDHIFLGADRFSAFLTDGFAEAHRETRYCEDGLRNRMLNELFGETVPVMLHEDDLAAMAYSVENRAAFLDSRLVEFLFTVPTEHLIHDGLPKYLLRATGRGIVDKNVLANPRKQGINAPVTNFLDFNDSDTRDRLLSDSPLFDYVRRDKVAALIDTPPELNSESKFLFSLISLKLWLEAMEDPV